MRTPHDRLAHKRTVWAGLVLLIAACPSCSLKRTPDQLALQQFSHMFTVADEPEKGKSDSLAAANAHVAVAAPRAEGKSDSLAAGALPAAVSPLLAAAKTGSRSEVESLLMNGAPIDQKGPGGETALHWASAYGQTTTVELLLVEGANVKAKVVGGATALHLASEEGHKDTVEALLARGAEPNARNEDGATPLHFAAAGDQVEVIEALAAHGAEIGARDDLGGTPLHMAAAYGKVRAVETLLRRGADPTVKDEDGNTALDLAVSNGNQETAKRFSTSGITDRASATSSPIPEGVYAGEVSFSVEVGCSERWESRTAETSRKVEEFTFGPSGLVIGSGPLRVGTTETVDGESFEMRTTVVGIHANATGLQIDYDTTVIARREGQLPINLQGQSRATYTLNADGTLHRETKMDTSGKNPHGKIVAIKGASHGTLRRQGETYSNPSVPTAAATRSPSNSNLPCAGGCHTSAMGDNALIVIGLLLWLACTVAIIARGMWRDNTPR